MNKAKILVLCTQNSCRSQMAEAMIRHKYGPRVKVFSAGAEPAPQVHPLAVETLASLGISTEGQHPKNTDTFANEHFDIVITTCDPARDTCPVFSGRHELRHWDLDDPAKAQGSPDDIRAAFLETARLLECHIAALDAAIANINRG